MSLRVKEFGVESAEAYRLRIDPETPETPTAFKSSTNTQINKRTNKTHSEHIIEQERNFLFIFFKQEERQKERCFREINRFTEGSEPASWTNTNSGESRSC